MALCAYLLLLRIGIPFKIINDFFHLKNHQVRWYNSFIHPYILFLRPLQLSPKNGLLSLKLFKQLSFSLSSHNDLVLKTNFVSISSHKIGQKAWGPNCHSHTMKKMGRRPQVVQFQLGLYNFNSGCTISNICCSLSFSYLFILFYDFGQMAWSHYNNHPSPILCPWKLSRWPTTLNPLHRYTSVCDQNTKTSSSFGLTSLISRLTFKAAERKVMRVELSKLGLLHTRVLELGHNSLQEQLFLGG